MSKNMSTARRKEMPDGPNDMTSEDNEILRMPPGLHTEAKMWANARRWQTIWPQVIAHAWAEPDFKAHLLQDARAAICAKFGYELSPELKLTIEDASTGTYNPHGAPGKDRWEYLPKMELKLYIPPAPPVEHRAVAITHYSETGRTYPMTSG